VSIEQKIQELGLEVEYVALVNDAGDPLQGFFSTADFAAYCGHLPNLDDVPY
jgi:hypothetical protein